MKLLRVGEIGKERPAILDKNNKVKDLSSHIKDFNSDNLKFETILKLKNLNLEELPEVKSNERIGPCISKPGKFVAIGLNYSDHAKETGLKIPAEPIVFMKATSSISGPNDNIEMPKESKKLDWEAELGFVIGKETKNITEKNAADHILGYVSRGLQVALWCSVFYFWLANDITWISNVKQFFILYTTALVLGLFGQMLLGYIFDERKPQTSIIPTIITQILKGQKEVNLGSLTPTRDLTFVKDTVLGFIAIGQCNQLCGEITNIGMNTEISVEQLVKKIMGLLNTEIHVKSEESRIRPVNSEVNRLKCNHTKLKKYTDWEANYDLTSGLQETISWFQNYYDFSNNQNYVI